MINLRVYDFTTGYDETLQVMERIAEYCSYVGMPISIFGDESIVVSGDSLIFPNVVYVEALSLLDNVSILKVLPNLTKVGRFWSSGIHTDMGIIDEIDNYSDLGATLSNDDYPLIVKKVGDNRYEFKRKKYSRIIKINN